MFKDLHRNEKPLIICNVWDVASALIAEQQGFSAIGTSSAAIASMLGQEDGEQIEFQQLLSIVDSICKTSSLPLTVDIESGYGDTPQTIANNIIQLTELGVVGINIEDSVVVDGQRALCDAESFGRTLQSVTTQLNNAGVEVFINVRSDTYLLNVDNTLKASIERANLYQNSGADGLFLPCIQQPNDIKKVVNSTALPVNVMCVPDLPDFATLEKLGVKRISMGNYVHQAMLASLSSTLISIVKENSFSPLFV